MSAAVARRGSARRGARARARAAVRAGAAAALLAAHPGTASAQDAPSPAAPPATPATAPAPSPAARASVGGTLTIDGRPAVAAVVALQSGRPAQPHDVAPRAVMDQRHLAFQPRVLPVVRGTVVEFSNNDDVEHNVFSPSDAAGRFDLGTYGSGQSREVVLDTAGDVRVLCNIHMEMEAHILVLEEPWAAVTGRDGGFEIRDVPAGSYELAVWSGRWLGAKRTVSVPASGTVTVDVDARR